MPILDILPGVSNVGLVNTLLNALTVFMLMYLIHLVQEGVDRLRKDKLERDAEKKRRFP